MKWIKDEDFIRGNVPMTKFNIRALNMVYLSIEEGDLFLDIGAGTGSISVEAALQGAKVWAIEKDREAMAILNKNKAKFHAEIEAIYGIAPMDLPNIAFDKCFIGGSTGKLKEIFIYLNSYLKSEGVLCANFIKLCNLNKFLIYLKDFNYRQIEVNLIQTSALDEIGLLKGDNPIFIVKGVRE